MRLNIIFTISKIYKLMEWIFDGIGTAIITLILGLLVGGTVGYKKVLIRILLDRNRKLAIILHRYK